MTLTKEELDIVRKKLGREPNEVELGILGAEWSEHCSYKSSKQLLKQLPTEGPRVIVGPGFDAGVVDVGDGYAITIHIESHNHPSAVEPYGGASTGVGGVIRDILSMGTRPIAVFDALRFGTISQSSHARWLFKHVVRGIADYGNCLGVPTVAGEVEFDHSFEGYCLVDVACIGLGKVENIIRWKVEPNDVLILAGGSTGRDGIHGAAFASRALEEENRAAVQIPDPFLEKLLIEATMEAINTGGVRAIKDLGGGGLSCCLSETADKLSAGVSVDLEKIHVREERMTPTELMISESQERMLYVVGEASLETFLSILRKYEINYSIVGRVKEDDSLVVRHKSNVVADMPASLVANAPLANRNARRPVYIDKLKNIKKPPIPKDMSTTLLLMLTNPTIANKSWVFQQYDHEVGLRTVLKPGQASAAVLRLDNNKFLAFKLDGNSKQCYIDPYYGAMGCFAEACRNVVAVGAEPIGMVDHLQFGNPENPEVFWTFTETIKALAEYGRAMGIPCVGGKVSFYNETERGPIKPTPVIGVVGLISEKAYIRTSMARENESLIVLGETNDEMGGSEYYEYIHGVTGGTVPKVNLEFDAKIMKFVQDLIREDLVSAVNDCSKGGLAISISEMCLLSGEGVTADLTGVPNKCSSMDNLLFSETHSRFVVSVSNVSISDVKTRLEHAGIPFAVLGRVGGATIRFKHKGSDVVNVSIDKAVSAWNNTLEGMMENG